MTADSAAASADRSHDRRLPVTGFLSTLATIWRLAIPYFSLRGPLARAASCSPP